MAKNNKVSMPSSGAGITQYFNEVRSKIMLKPEHVMIIIIVVIILEVFLHIQGGTWFG